MARLLILSSEFPPGPGGIGTHAFQLASNLQALGHMIKVVTQQDYASKEQISAFNQACSFKVHRLPQHFSTIREGWLRYQLIQNVCRRYQPELIVASGSRSVWLSALIKTLLHIPYLAVGHGTEFGVRDSWVRYLTCLAFNHADAVVCVSQYTRSRLKELGIQNRHELVITNGADGDFFQPFDPEVISNIRTKFGLDGEFVLLTVGNVNDRKGQDIVIRALPEVIKHFPDIQYWIVGLPTNEKQLAALCAELGVRDRVRFWGNVPREQLPLIYNAADLFILTSRQTTGGDFEGYGIVVVEAALSGKAAVVSTGSGLEEAVIHDQTGLHVPPEDTEATANAIIRLMSDRNELTQLSQNARSRAVQSQTWKAVSREYDHIIRSLLIAA